MRLRTYVLLAALALSWPSTARAQTTTIRQTDEATKAPVNAGDDANDATRVTCPQSSAAAGGCLTQSDFDSKTGSLTETAPATDTASSGLNGRLQRLAQRTTTIISTLGSPFQAGGSIGNTAFGATQSGTWTVQPGNTANTTAWLVTGVGGTFPISGSIANLSFAATQVTASNLNAQVVGVVASGGSNAGNPVKTAGVYNSTQPTVTNGQIVDTQHSARGSTLVTAAVEGLAISNTTFAATQATASSFNAQVVGAVASAGTNAGNPVKQGCAYNTTQPTVTNGQVVDQQCSPRGATLVSAGVEGLTVVPGSGFATDVAEDTPETDGVTGPVIQSVRRDTPVTSAGASADYATVNTGPTGGVWTTNTDPCGGAVRPVTTAFSVTTDTVIVAPVSGKYTHVCSIEFTVAADEQVSIVQGTTPTCTAVSRVAMFGDSTDANGPLFAAKGGMGRSGAPTLWYGQTQNVQTCLTVNTGGIRVAGSITTVNTAW